MKGKMEVKEYVPPHHSVKIRTSERTINYIESFAFLLGIVLICLMYLCIIITIDFFKKHCFKRKNKKKQNSCPDEKDKKNMYERNLAMKKFIKKGVALGIPIQGNKSKQQEAIIELDDEFINSSFDCFSDEIKL